MSRQLGLNLAMIAGFVALALLGGPALAVAPFAVVACLVAPFVRGRLQRIPWPLITGPVMIGITLWLWRGVDRQQALGLALMYLQVHRWLARRVVADDRVSVLLSGLMIVACASNTEDPAFLAVVVAWALALPVALMPHHSPRTRGVGRTAIAMSVGVFAFACGLFVTLPRFSADSGLNSGASLTGFTPDVELGVIVELFDDPVEVFRVQISPTAPGPVYFRGVALDLFDGRRWWSSGDVFDAEIAPPDSFPADAYKMVVTLQGYPEGVLFTAGEILHIAAEGQGLRRDQQSAWFVERPGRVVRYTMMTEGDLGPHGSLGGRPETDLRPWTSIPENLDPRIEALAVALVGNETDPEVRATRIGDYLRSEYAYTRVPRDQGEEGPLSVFLFDRKTGHCEYFASAQAILLRTVGVPTRLVNGFAGGELDPATGDLVFRGYHAHSWVEVHVPGRGWVLADATPGPQAMISPPPAPGLVDALAAFWDTAILGWDRDAQIATLIAAGRRVERALPVVRERADRVPFIGLGLLVGLSALVGGILQVGMDGWLNRLAGDTVVRPRGPVADQHYRARRHLEKQGWRIPVSLPPLEAARWVQSQTTEDAAPLEELVWLYYNVRYGREKADSSVSEARRLAGRVMQLGPPRASS